jgi:glycosyltransferase involved in cell wall biosynthesis
MAVGLPTLSVVVPSVNGWSDLEGCLAALAAQDLGQPIEILVADRLGTSLRQQVHARFPNVRVIEAPAGTTIPDLRALAFEAATGDVVGVIEDHVLVPTDWARRMLELQANGARVVGGSVANAATARLVDWAAFLCEYSQSLVPPVGPSDWVTGNNTTYQRALLLEYKSVWTAGKWENHLHDAFKRDGVELLSRPDITVGHKMHYSVGSYLEQRYLYSRSYAGMQSAQSPAVRRFIMGCVSFALPPVLFARIVSRVWSSGKHRGELIRSLPLQALFTIGWAAGEVVGWWAGPSDALRRVV